MTELSDLRPEKLARIMDLLSDAGVDVSMWSDYKGKHPSANPKYCYNWSFEKSGEMIIVCLWHQELSSKNDEIFYSGNLRQPLKGKGKAQWKARAEAFDMHLRGAYQNALPVKAIILGGKPRYNDDDEPESSVVSARMLDDAPWAVSFYDINSGDFVVSRNAMPIDQVEKDDLEYSAFEGDQRRLYVLHRRRENSLRAKKIIAAKYENGGRLTCEVPGCGFDFEKRYGVIGAGFAHVHHLLPLAGMGPTGGTTSLKDLVIVCANCHAMIHVGGENRPLKDLIPRGS